MNPQKLINIIRSYRSLRKQNPDTWIQFAEVQSNLKDAITVSALCYNHENKRHPHQYRIPREALEITKDELLDQVKEIESVKTFDELYQIIDSLEIHGLGRLTKYDIATRIGTYLQLYPDRVYLHAGTKAGAKKLLGKSKLKYLLKKDLPLPFRDRNLEYWEIEDILCIYKDRFDHNTPEEVRRKCLC